MAQHSLIPPLPMNAGAVERPGRAARTQGWFGALAHHQVNDYPTMTYDVPNDAPLGASSLPIAAVGRRQFHAVADSGRPVPDA